MVRGAALAVGLALTPLLLGAADLIYKIELRSPDVLWSQTPPVPKQDRFFFRRHPDGMLLSVPRAQVRRIVSLPIEAPAVTTLRPGETRVIAAPASLGSARTARPRSPGERPDGTSALYREGGSFAHPPATAVQESPGEPPTGVPSGEPPKMPDAP